MPVFKCHPNYCQIHKAAAEAWDRGETITTRENEDCMSIVAGGIAKLTLPEPTAMDAFEAVVNAIKKHGDGFTATHALTAIHNMIQEYPAKHQVLIADGSVSREPKIA